MENEFKRIVEINGLKIEVDLRTAKRVDQFKVGDAVKILQKKYGDSYESYFGMIIGFDEFKSLPTIIVAYLEPSSWEIPLKFVYITSASKDVEICAHDANDLGLQKADIVQQFRNQINKREMEIAEIKRKESYFINMFGKYFPTETVESTG